MKNDKRKKPIVVEYNGEIKHYDSLRAYANESGYSVRISNESGYSVLISNASGYSVLNWFKDNVKTYN